MTGLEVLLIGGGIVGGAIAIKKHGQKKAQAAISGYNPDGAPHTNYVLGGGGTAMTSPVSPASKYPPMVAGAAGGIGGVFMANDLHKLPALL